MKLTKDTFATYGQIILACMILAVSINMFLGPHDVAAGGASGIGIIIEEVTNINRAWVVLGLNILMLILAYVFLGKDPFSKILAGSILFPLILRIVPTVQLTSDRLLSVIFGSIVFAIGVAILYRIQASSGGTTVPPLILEKYWNMNTSVGLLLTDILIVFSTIFVFGFEEFLFAILSILITSIVMLYIETGLKLKKAVMIISPNYTDEIKAELAMDGRRGMTLFDAKGGHSGAEREMILMVMNNQDYPRIKNMIEAIDPTCFLITYNVAEVHGLGFSYQPIQ